LNPHHTAVALTLTITLTCDLETAKQCHFQDNPKFIPYTKFEHFGIVVSSQWPTSIIYS